jgi:hypothetical protein
LASPPTTLFQELALAARGVLALASGDRAAPRYFDFSQRGLVGSFIALLAIIGFMAAQPLFGAGSAEGGVASRLFVLALPVVAQFLGAGVALRQMNRADAFIPYLVCANWTSFLGAVLSEVLLFLGFDANLLLMTIGIFTLVVTVNIARLVMTLSVGQIVVLFVAQVVAAMVALLLIGVFVPPSPEAAAAAAAAAQLAAQ